MQNLIGSVVRDDPGEDGVLREIVERPASDRVEAHQVLEVGDVPGVDLVN
jgi:hypothetical protein